MSELDEDRLLKARKLFKQAISMDADQREEYVFNACGKDDQLRNYVLDLLKADSETDATLEPTIISTDGPSFSDDASEAYRMHGQKIGPYRVQRLLGSGGMAMVYLAERADSQFDQQVAIKLGRHRLVDPQTEIRLRHERQFLADLDHPNIARLFDGGTTEDGVPYIVMEFIDGVRIDNYCNLHRLNVADRLRLFQTICSAVHYAHQNLIIHRDIKATNILVTEKGTAKLLDFGIAKLSDAAGAATDGLTREGAVIMTPANGAPEQINGQTITTATDVYGLGLLLYYLLSGLRAYETENATPSQIARLICDDEVISPSRQLARRKKEAEKGNDIPASEELAEIAADRSTSIDGLQRLLRGDLDTIVLNALRKEPTRRYRSANAIADDIDRYLKLMPIVAREDSWRYRTAKYIQRHVVAVSAAALAVVMLAGSAILLSVQNRHILEERDTAREAVQFLEDIFMAHDPSRARGADITAAEILSEGANRIRSNLGDRPDIQSSLMGTIGRVYYNLGEYQQSEEMLEQALRLRLETDGESHPSVAAARNDLAEVLIRRADYERAAELLLQALAINQLSNEGTSPLVATNLFNLADAYLALGKLDEAESSVRSSIAIFVQLRDQYSVELAEAKSTLARILQVRGDLDQTEQLLLEAIEIISDSEGTDHPYMAYYLQNLGVLQRSKGDLVAAEQTLQTAIAAVRRTLGDKHDLLAVTLVDQGMLLQMKGDYDAAEDLVREALVLDAEIHGNSHPRLGRHKTILGMVLHDKGDLDAAESALRDALEIFAQALDADHQYTASALTELGAVLNTAGRASEALTLLETALDIREKDYAPSHVLVAATRSEYGDTLSRLGRYDEAETLLEESLAVLRERPGRRLKRTNAALLRLRDLANASGPLMESQ